MTQVTKQWRGSTINIYIFFSIKNNEKKTIKEENTPNFHVGELNSVSKLLFRQSFTDARPLSICRKRSMARAKKNITWTYLHTSTPFVNPSLNQSVCFVKHVLPVSQRRRQVSGCCLSCCFACC